MIRGIKTSEMWLIVCTTVAGFASKKLGIPVTAAAVAEGAAAIYAFGRSYVKAHLPVVAADVSGIERRVSTLETTIKASPALSAEQAAALAKISEVAQAFAGKAMP